MTRYITNNTRKIPSIKSIINFISSSLSFPCLTWFPHIFSRGKKYYRKDFLVNNIYYLKKMVGCVMEDDREAKETVAEKEV